MRNLSKSKIIAFRQCPKRLWLEVHRPEVKEETPGMQARFDVGHQVGEIARRLYDPTGDGVTVDVQRDGFSEAFRLSAELLAAADRPVFEAGFQVPGALAFADVMLPVGNRRKRAWKMVEVKSSASVKDYHREDIAVQAFIARSMGVRLSEVCLAHIDTKWVYPGDGDYRGLLVEHDLTADSLAMAGDAKEWIQGGQETVRKRTEPEVSTGSHCSDPFECPFVGYCSSKEVQPEHPVDCLPRLTQKQRTRLQELGVTELGDVPEELLNPQQRLVRKHTLANKVFHDKRGAASALGDTGFPAHFLDFETAGLAVPVWPGTRPFQQIPVQFSLHIVREDMRTDHHEFLGLDGSDPSRALAEALLAACEPTGPVFVYNATFERSVMRSLAERFPDLSRGLGAITGRIVDLLPIARDHYYHPGQQGSWSIKSVLPAAVPQLSYDDLDGVKDGSAAMDAFAEAIRPETSADLREEIRRELLAYCERDTLAMVAVWQFFRGSRRKPVGLGL